MAKNYGFTFGGNPSDNTGLSPTLTLFKYIGGVTTAAPAIIEDSPGFYYFAYAPTMAISFTVDGGAALADAVRYFNGVLDPIQTVDQKVGTTDDSYGSTSVDPSTVLGFLKRNLEFDEGNANFNKSSGVWDIYSRGSTTLLREKTLANNTTETTKT